MYIHVITTKRNIASSRWDWWKSFRNAYWKWQNSFRLRPRDCNC